MLQSCECEVVRRGKAGGVAGSLVADPLARLFGVSPKSIELGFRGPLGPAGGQTLRFISAADPRPLEISSSSHPRPQPPSIGLGTTELGLDRLQRRPLVPR